MFYYIIHGLKVASDYKMEAAFAVDEFGAEERDVSIHRGKLFELAVETEEEVAAGKGYYYRYEKTKGWVRAIGNGCFLMQNGNEVIYQLKEGHDPLLVGEVLLCLCLGVIMIQKKKLILHGSGILWGDKAVILSGKSGAGKSTLAQAMLLGGGFFMSDDSVAVAIEAGKAYALPAYPQQKLTIDAAASYNIDLNKLIKLSEEGGKQKYALRFSEGFSSEKKEISAMIVLQVKEGEKGNIKKIIGNEKLKYFTDNLYKHSSYRVMGFDKDAFMESVQIINQIEIYSLIRPPCGLAIEEEMEMVRRVVGEINQR